jgi:hypothetical protein
MASNMTWTFVETGLLSCLIHAHLPPRESGFGGRHLLCASVHSVGDVSAWHITDNVRDSTNEWVRKSSIAVLSPRLTSKLSRINHLRYLSTVDSAAQRSCRKG